MAPGDGGIHTASIVVKQCENKGDRVEISKDFRNVETVQEVALAAEGISGPKQRITSDRYS
jgi:hypothetical protein